MQALQQVDKFRGEQQEILSERTATPTSQLKFIVDAWMQVGASRLSFVCLGLQVRLHGGQYFVDACMQVQGCWNDNMRLGRFARFVWWFVVPGDKRAFQALARGMRPYEMQAYHAPSIAVCHPTTAAPAGGALPPHPQVDVCHRLLHL